MIIGSTKEKNHLVRGEQRVHVEHVHVNEGGRAIVGNVGQGGSGLKQKVEEGPHA